MNIFNDFKEVVYANLQDMVNDGFLPEGIDFSRAVVEPPRDASHGDMATNAALILSKQAKSNPRAIGEELAKRLKEHKDIKEVNVAGPGFVNFFLNSDCWIKCLTDILNSGLSYGQGNEGENQAINVEYVSANPTGPLTAGHARGAVIGDALSNLLEKAGYNVVREFYVNDAGAQVGKLAGSTYLRYCEALGEDIGQIPEGFYPGEYLKAVGEALAKRDGDKWLMTGKSQYLPVCQEIALEMMQKLIKDDLSAIGVKHDVFTSEKRIVESGAVDEAYKILKDKGLIYMGVLEPPKGLKPADWEERPQTLFKATEFGDDVDRPLKKADGEWTYFSNDIAYHWDKYKRGSNVLINILGADHGGYVKRIKAAVNALTDGKAEVDCRLCQMVHMFEDGKPVKMSKRAGTFITLRDVLDKVGSDVLRFIMLTRRSDQTLDFDFNKVTEKSKDNPVFYVQYAHARCYSVFRNAQEMWSDIDITAEGLSDVDLSCLTSEAELQLIRLMAGWPRLVAAAAESYEPHRVAFYVQELAAEFHSFWSKGREDTSLRFLIEDDVELSKARLALVRSVATVLASGLAIIGVKPVEELHS